MNQHGTSECDIAIVGGGLAGASLAIALAPLGFTIRVIEAVALKAAEQPSYDDRTLALSHSSCRILAGIGLWENLKAEATAIRKITVTELNRPVRVLLDAAEMGLSEFGHVVEARSFGSVVVKKLLETQGIELSCPASVEAIEVGRRQSKLRLVTPEGTETLSARLVIAADGADSFIRKHLQVPTQTRDYHQSVIICNVTPQEPHRGRAFECLTPTGPFAILPHTGMRCGLVWSVADTEAEPMLALEDSEFLARAESRFGPHLGKFIRLGKRSAYPLRLVRASKDTAERLVILGNAAHAIHPVGAQGFNLALRDVATLAEVLADDNAGDPGEAILLQQYSDWRRLDQRSTIAFSDGITRLFAHPSVLAAGLRSSAMIALALLPSLRRRQAIKAMGYRGKVPRLALGERLRPA